jgi:hypothetical protein
VSVILLPLFVLFNVLLLRALVRLALKEGAWLRDPEIRAKVLREYGLDELGRKLLPGIHFFTIGPMHRLMVVLGVIGLVLVADYVTIRSQFPWLLFWRG